MDTYAFTYELRLCPTTQSYESKFVKGLVFFDKVVTQLFNYADISKFY